MTTSTVTNKIIDTANFKHLVIAEDAVDSIQFTIPKTYDGNDLSAGTVYSLWTIPGGSGDMTELTTTVSGDNLLSVWPLSGAVVSKKGMVEFQLVILVGTTIVWKSKIAYFFVDRKLDPTDLDFTPDVLTAHLATVIAARDRAETAADTAEGVLTDAEFQIVADDLALLEESLIKQVALNKTNIDLVAAAKTNIDLVAAAKTNIDLVAAAKTNIDALAPVASDMQTLAPQAAAIGTLAPVASAIAALDAIKAAISALDLIKTDITGVNGIKADVSAVSAKLTEVQAVYAKLTAIEAVYGKTTEIDALYAQLDTIAAKANQTDLDATNVRVTTLEQSSAKRFGLYFFDDGTFQRTGDAVGKVFRSHAGSYTAGIVSDFSLEHPWAGFKNCILDSDGVVRAWQGDPTYATTDGEWMEFVPRCYTGMTAKTVGGKACLHFEVSNVRLPGLYPTGFIGADGKELAGIFVGRVPLGTSGTLVTKPAVAPTTNKTMTSFTTDIRAKSATGKWRLYDAASWTMLTILMAVETGSLDVKTTIGGGIQSSMPYGSGNEFKCTVSQTAANSIIIANAGATNMRVGMTMQVGTAYTNNNVAANRVIQSIESYDASNKTVTLDGAAFNSTSGTTTIVSWGQPVPADQIDALYGESGYITQFDSAARSHVCYRGIWDLWGNVWQWLAGVLRVEGKFYISFNRDEHDEFSPVGKPHWLDTGWEPNIANGYQKERKIISYPSGQVSLPKTTGGTGVGANTWYAAYLYYFGVDYRTGVRAVPVGGNWYNGAYVSPFYWHGYNTPSETTFLIGARSVIEMVAA